MRTSYWVQCPHPGCDWAGVLPPRDVTVIWREEVPARQELLFECPRCSREWRAEAVGDEVETLPLDELPVSD